MEDSLDKKLRDEQIPEEELLEELDAMYQRVADIEKEEAAEVSTQRETALFLEPEIPVAPEKPSKKKQRRNKKRDYRPIVLATTAILLVFILGITFWKPMAILQLLRIGDVQQPTVPPRPAPRKPPVVATPKAPPAPPTAATLPSNPIPPAAVTPPALPIPPTIATSPAPPKPASGSVPAQTKQEAAKSPNLLPQGKYFAIQIGSFREMENVRDLVGVLKKEGLDAYWIASESKRRGALYKVFVGQFMDRNEAVQFQKDKDILKNYPDSFIQELSSSKIGP